MRIAARLIALFLLLFCVKPAIAVTATFNADKVSGCAPLVVNFTPVDPPCSGCTYSWNFGTGSPVGGYTASSSFLTTGTHVVTLTVTSGATTISSTRSITVYPSPTVNFTASDTAFCPGGSVTLTNASTNGVPGSATYKWSLGDGDTSLTANTSHTYLVPGYYNIALTVTNAQGCARTLTKTTLIHVYTPPKTQFTPSKSILCNPPVSVAFSNTTTGDGPISYVWRFGDMQVSTTTNPSHTYSNTGTYNVWLRATDVHGCPDSATITPPIVVGGVTANFNFNDSVCRYGTVNFTNTSTTHTFRKWFFGDGATSLDINPSHVYTAAGTYVVKLAAGYSPCVDTATKVVHIMAGPSGSYYQTPAEPCPAPVNVTYTSTAPPGTIVDWLFEKKIPASGPSVLHNYAVDSIVYIRMIKTDPLTGCKDTVQTMDTLYSLIPNIYTDTSRGCAPFNVDFLLALTTPSPDGSTIIPYPYGITSNSWDFGDGLGATGITANHTFVDTGIYRVKITTTTNNGCTIEDSTFIFAGMFSAAEFTASPLHACREDTITFIATVTEAFVDSFVWDFGDFQTFSKKDTIRRAFTLPGNFTVTLTPCYHGCCSDTFIRRDYVLIDSPGVTMYYQFNCPIDRQVLFFDSSLGNDSTIWSFGDGDTSYVRYPPHTYDSAGTYPIELIAISKVTGCVDRRRDTIYVADPKPYFNAVTDTQICEEDTVSFLVHDTTGARLSYSWITGDTVTPFFDQTGYSYIYKYPGRYTVQVVTWDDNDCHDTATRVNYVTLGKPIAGFAPAAPVGCVPLTMNFTDTTRNVIGLTTTSYAWQFGDGDTITTTSPSVSHIYTAAGTYTVTEVVTNNNNCSDTTTRVIVVKKAEPSFLVSNGNPCIGTVVDFDNISPALVTVSWAFGDGATSTVTSPSHAYADTGHYDVVLTITDTNTCTASAMYTIVVGKPIASFTVSDTVSVCLPYLAQFYNHTIGGATYEWNFGDGHTALVPSPTNNYTVGGVYIVTLTATSAYGCSDTTTGHVRVYGYPGSFTYTPLSGCSPLTVHFSSALTNVPNISWDFADGVISTVSTVDTISHTYTTPGAYVPKLIMSNNAGCVTSSIGLDTIKVSKVTAGIALNPAIVCPRDTFIMSSTSTTYWSPITTYSWSYDGYTSTLSNPRHAITTAGTYPVRLQVTNGWGCTDTISTPVTVKYVAPITGDTSICTGQNTTLSDFTTGGTWSSSSTAIATIGSSTGVLAGVASGSVVVTYHALGCYVTAIGTVSQTPPAIAGTYSVCAGSTTPLSNSLTGGTWASSNPAIATITTSGIVNGLSAGTCTVTYTVGECYVTAIVTVAVMPGTITGVGTVCTGLTTNLSNGVSGGVWSSSDTSIVKVNSTGVASGINTGTATITYAIGSCFTTSTVTVNNTIPEIAGTFTICPGSTTTLTNSATGGTWTSADTAIAVISTATGELTGKHDGSVIITYSLGGGCIDTAVMTVLVAPDAGSIEGPEKICTGASATFTNAASGGTWANTEHHSTLSGTLISATSPGIDTLSFTVSNGVCSATTTKVIEIVTLPAPGSINAAGPFCVGATTTLSVTPANPGTWTTSNSALATIDTSTAFLTATGTGTVKISFIVSADANGCRDTAYADITITEPSFSIVPKVVDVNCYGKDNGRVTLAIAGTPPFVYRWSTADTTDAIDSLAPGTYSVTVTQPATQCRRDEQYTISQPDSITVEAEIIADTCQLKLGAITTTVSGGSGVYHYAWSDSTHLIDSVNTAIVFQPKGMYTLTVTDDLGCVDSNVYEIPEGPCKGIVIYDVITPNGDGVNDYWVINGITDYPGNLVQIFDKWGDLVYEKNGYKKEWTGQGSKGGELPDGVYYYIVKLNEPSKTGGETEFAGTVMIKR
ncbi:MAG: PKD domain-containing protein [Taibaiella sp.]|nr:PKD domain-containing protein [Taibaiella sp.]